MVVHARVNGLLHVLGEGVRRLGDDGDALRLRVAARADGARGSQTVHLRHHDVHQNRVERRFAALPRRRKRRDGLLPVFDSGGLRPRAVQQILRDLAAQGVVLGQQDPHPVQVGQCLGLLAGLRRGVGVDLQRQLDDECRPLPQLACGGDRAAHAVDQFLRDGHPQTGALEAVRRVPLLRERLVHVLQEFLAHADAGVLDRKAVDRMGRVLRQLVEGIVDRAADAVILDGVAGNIRDDALDMQWAAVDDVVRVVKMHIAGQLHPVALRVQSVAVARQQFVQIKPLVQQFDAAALQPAHVQHVVDESFQLLARRGQLCQRAAHRLRIVGVFLRDARHAEDAVQRRADVVAHAGEEGRFGAVRGLGAVARLDERLLVPVQLVAIAEGQQPHHAAVRQLLIIFAEAEPAAFSVERPQAERPLAAIRAEVFALRQRGVLGKETVCEVLGAVVSERFAVMAAQCKQRQLADQADGQAVLIIAANHADTAVLLQKRLDGFFDRLQIPAAEISSVDRFRVKAFYHTLNSRLRRFACFSGYIVIFLSARCNRDVIFLYSS